MPIENYSLNDIETILTIFSLNQKNYLGCKRAPMHCYYKIVKAIKEINLVEETMEYLHDLLQKKITPTSERRVAFIGENNTGRFAMIVFYKAFNFSQTQEIFSDFYEKIEVHCLIPPHFNSVAPENEIAQHLARLTTPIYHVIYDPTDRYKSVTLTESILNLLLDGEFNPNVMIIPALEKHKHQCVKQLRKWFALLHKHDKAMYQKIVDLLGILMKYHQLEKRREALQAISFLHMLLQQDDVSQKEFFALPLGDLGVLIEGLSMNTITLLLSLTDDPNRMLQKLTEYKAIQLQQFREWGSRMRESKFPLPVRAWSDLGREKTRTTANYLWDRSPIKLYSSVTRMLFFELMPQEEHYPKITTTLDYFLWMILSLGALLSMCLPQNMRPIQAADPLANTREKAAQFGSFIGAGMGSLILWHGGAFELVFSYSLIFLTEFFHEQFTRDRIDVNKACLFSMKRFVPSMSNLMSLNRIFLLALYAFYIDDSLYLKSSLTAVGCLEAFRRLFLKMSPRFNLTAEARNASEYMFSMLGISFGEFLFSTYHHVQAKFTSQQKAIDMFTKLTQKAHQAVTYTRAEVPDFSLNPSLWFNSENPLQLTWGDELKTYQTMCDISASFNGETGIVVCDAPQQLSLMLPKK